MAKQTRDPDEPDGLTEEEKDRLLKQAIREFILSGFRDRQQEEEEERQRSLAEHGAAQADEYKASDEADQPTTGKAAKRRRTKKLD